MVDDILGCMDSGSVAVVVGLDISAAFDTVCQQTLLGRLELEFGIRGISLECMGGILSVRFQCVSVNLLRLLSRYTLASHRVPC